MPRDRKTARSTTYSMQMAQLQVADFPPGTRRLGQNSDAPHGPTVKGQRPFPLAKVIDSLDHAFPFPGDLRSFLIYCAVLFLIVVGMMVNVLPSAQILQSQVHLVELKNRHATLERQNGELIWKIARATNLQNVQAQAIAQGYAPITQREFVQMPVPGVRSDERAAVHLEEKLGAVVQGAPAVTAQLQTAASQAPLAQRLGQWRALLLQDSEPEIGALPRESAADLPPSSSLSTDPQAAPWWLTWKEQVVDNAVALVDRIAGQ